MKKTKQNKTKQNKKHNYLNASEEKGKEKHKREKLWNMRETVKPIVDGEFGTVPEG